MWLGSQSARPALSSIFARSRQRPPCLTQTERRSRFSARLENLCAASRTFQPERLTARSTNAVASSPWHAPRRSEERRVGKECRSRWAREHEIKKGIETRASCERRRQR